MTNNDQRLCNGVGVSPGQIMAILIVELRQEVLAQRRRVKEQIKKQDKAKWMVTNPLAESSDESDEEESDDDDDAGVMNKIRDRKGRKEFETDMHSMVRSYNQMLAQDLRGIPEVKANIADRLRKAVEGRANRSSTRPMMPWMRGQLTQRLFSYDDVDQNQNPDQQSPTAGQESDDEGSKKSQGSGMRKMKLSARITGSLMRNKSPKEPTGLTVEATSAPPSEGVANNENDEDNLGTVSAGRSKPQSALSLIEEGDEDKRDQSALSIIIEDGEEHKRNSSITLDPSANQDLEAMDGLEAAAQPKITNSGGGKMNQSRLFEIIESMKGIRAARAPDDDLHSLKSDPGPNQSWPGDGIVPELSDARSRPPPMSKRASSLKRDLTQHLTSRVERYREDHVLHKKLIIPADDYETFAGAEDVGNNMVRLASSFNLGTMASMSGVPQTLAQGGDPERNMSEKELLDFMKRCVESRNVDSLDFMADFFRPNTISQTMVKSKAQVVWLQDWFPIKDCIYAISVDEKKKRVLVVFRGATTRADWNHGFDAAMKKTQNPVKDTYEGKKQFVTIHRGFHTYLFRTRKDTSTRKYDEIANKVYEYGNKIIGSDFTVTVNGYSLGGALSILFGFYASTDDRFTQNGPVKIFSYGSPYAAGHAFADAFRHQERKKKVQHARFYNSNDIVAHLPFNMKPTKRGSNFVHVGVDVKLLPVPGKASLWGTREPRIRHNDRQTPMAAYWRALKMNSLLNMALPWRIQDQHGLPELQKRIARAAVRTNKLTPTLDEIYERVVYKKED